MVCVLTHACENSCVTLEIIENTNLATFRITTDHSYHNHANFSIYIRLSLYFFIFREQYKLLLHIICRQNNSDKYISSLLELKFYFLSIQY